MGCMTSSAVYAIPGMEEEVKRVLQKREEEKKAIKPKELSPEKKIEKIIPVILYHFGITEEELKSKCRRIDLVIARYFCFFFITKYTTLSQAVIGEEFGGRDHATVSHGLSELTSIVDQNYKGFGVHFKAVQEEINKLNFYEEIKEAA